MEEARVKIENLAPREGNREEGGYGDLEGLAASIAADGILPAAKKAKK